jgi:tRNA dimethylallyltransferase
LNRSLLVIVGPTGTGKTPLALDIAETFRGEIVNCDSTQLYRGFDIGTAKTPPDDRRNIPHHLLDILSPTQQYSAGEYCVAARAVLDEISARGCLPVVVGGTGFYLRALLQGLPKLPQRDEKLREKLVAREQRTRGALHRILTRLDPNAARRIHPNDIQKTVRALEVRMITQQHIPESRSAEPLRDFRVLKLGIDPDRKLLHARLNLRTETMFSTGLLEEVRHILSSGATGDEKPFESINYRQALQHIRGHATLEEAIASAQLEARRYAKRQWTWFRRDPQVRWLKGFGDDPTIRLQALVALQSFYKNSR